MDSRPLLDILHCILEFAYPFPQILAELGHLLRTEENQDHKRMTRSSPPPTFSNMPFPPHYCAILPRTILLCTNCWTNILQFWFICRN